MLSAVDGVVNLAAASEMDLAEASDMVTDYLSAFGLEASDANRMVDELAYAQAHSNTTTQQLGEAYKNCAANMHASGQSMETTTALLEALANQGVKGSEAGTKLSAIMRDLTKNMEDGSIKIGDTSVAVTDANGNFRDMTDIVTDIEAATYGMGDAERAVALQSTFTSDSISGLNMILNEGAGNITAYKDSLYESEGAASAMAETMQDNLQGKITEAGSALEGLGIAVYEQISGPLTEAVGLFTNAIQGVTGLISPAKSDVQTFNEEVKAANEAVAASIQSAQSTVENAEAKVAEISAYGQEFSDILGQCEQFNEITLDTGEKAITDSSGKIVEKIGEVGEKATTVDEILAQFAPKGLATDGIEESQKTISESLGYVRNDFDETTGAVQQTYVITDAFTRSKITTMVNRLGGAVEGLAEAWNEETGELSASREQLESWFDTAKDVAMYNALTSAIQELYTAWGEASVNVVKAESGLNAAEKALADYCEQVGMTDEQLWAMAESQTANGGAVDSTVQGYLDLKAAVSEAGDNVSDANDNLATAQTELDNTAAGLKEVKDSYTETGEEAKTAAESTQTFANSISELDEDTQNAIEAMRNQQAATQELADITSEARDQIVEAFDDAKEAAESAFSIDPFGEWAQEAENGISKFLASMESQRIGMANYQANLSVLRDHVGEISPEFLSYLEGMGVGGAQLVQELAEAFNSGNQEQIQSAVDAFVQTFDVQEDLTTALAADNLAFGDGLDGIASTAEEWQGLQTAFDDLMTIVETNGLVLTDETTTAFNEAVEAAKEAGIKIPDGLAESIRSADNPEQAVQEATDKLNAAIEGQQAGLEQVAQKTGAAVPKGITSKIKSGVNGIVNQYSGIAKALTGKVGEFTSVGKGAGDAIGSGISGEEGNVTTASSTVINAAKSAGETAADTFSAPGRIAMMAFASGITAQESAVLMAVSGLASRVASSANGKMTVFNATGKEAATQLAKGITDNQSAISSAVSTATSNAAGSAASSDFYTAGSDLAGSIASGVSGNASKISTEVGTAVSGAAGAIDGYNATFQTKGSTLMNYLAAGITAKGPAVRDAVAAVVSYASGAAGGSGGTKGAARPTGPTAAENAFIRESAPSIVAASQQASTTYADSFNIVINQQPGQSAEAIVDEIERQLAFRTERRWAAYA